MHLLTSLLLLPAFGAIVIALLPAHLARAIRTVALCAAATAPCYSWGLLTIFDSGTAALQFVEETPWNPRLGTSFSLGVDGISFPLVLLGLKTGVYALVGFVFPLLPDAFLRWHEWVAAFALTGIFYAATLALMQINLRRLLAFAVISHTSVLVIGLFSLSQTALQGSILLSTTFGTATAGLLFMSGFVFRRTRTLILPRLGGLFGHLPVIGIAFPVAGLSIIGMPGTPGFDAVHLMLEAAILEFGAMVTIAAALGNVVAAAFLLWAFQRAFLGPMHNTAVIEAVDLRRRELAVILVPGALILAGGLFPNTVLELTRITSEDWIDSLAPHLGNTEQVVTPAEAGVQVVDLYRFRLSPE